MDWEKKHYKDKLSVKLNLEWGETNFTLLGIKFDVDLDNIISLNYDYAENQILKIIANWKKYLTPIFALETKSPTPKAPIANNKVF